MSSSWNPWPPEPQRRRSSGKKTARLVGTAPGKVYVLVKLHDWKGRAIYLYNLLTNEMIHIPTPTQEEWDRYYSEGTQITHPGGIKAEDAIAWVEYAKQEAMRLGLTVAEE